MAIIYFKQCAFAVKVMHTPTLWILLLSSKIQRV